MEDRALKGKIHPYSLIGALVVALILIGAAYLVFRARGGQRAPAPTNTGYQVTLLPAPTETPTAIPTALLPTPTLQDVSILPPDVVAVGRYVKVSGTQGVGLRMRTQAGTSGDVNFIALDDEAFKIIDGPLVSDGYTWWLCEALLDKTRSGWAAENYLLVLEISIQSP